MADTDIRRRRRPPTKKQQDLQNAKYIEDTSGKITTTITTTTIIVSNSNHFSHSTTLAIFILPIYLSLFSTQTFSYSTITLATYGTIITLSFDLVESREGTLSTIWLTFLTTTIAICTSSESHSLNQLLNHHPLQSSILLILLNLILCSWATLKHDWLHVDFFDLAKLIERSIFALLPLLVTLLFSVFVYYQNSTSLTPTMVFFPHIVGAIHSLVLSSVLPLNTSYSKTETGASDRQPLFNKFDKRLQYAFLDVLPPLSHLAIFGLHSITTLHFVTTLVSPHAMIIVFRRLLKKTKTGTNSPQFNNYENFVYCAIAATACLVIVAVVNWTLDGLGIARSSGSGWGVLLVMAMGGGSVVVSLYFSPNNSNIQIGHALALGSGWGGGERAKRVSP